MNLATRTRAGTLPAKSSRMDDDDYGDHVRWRDAKWKGEGRLMCDILRWIFRKGGCLAVLVLSSRDWLVKSFVIVLRMFRLFMGIYLTIVVNFNKMET